MCALLSARKKGYVITGIILAVLLSGMFVPSYCLQFVSAAVLIVAAVAVCALVKKRSILSFNKRQVLFLLAVIAVVYLMLCYMAGIHFGFARPYRYFSLDTLWRYILPYLAIIIASELIRSVMLAQNSRLVSFLLYLIGVLSELSLGKGFMGIDTMYRFMDFIGMAFFPALMANLFYHYISKRYGPWPNVVFRCVLTLYAYLIPIVPNIPQILSAFSRVILPLAALFFIDILFEKKKKLAAHQPSKWRFVGWGACVALMVSVIMLISCQFRYGILVIATESMTGEINKGDAIFFEEYKDQSIRTGDVIVFEKTEGTRIVHRVVNIENINGQFRYYTKGDANETLDPGYITNTEIVGVVHFKIVYIGFPSLWLRELFD